MSFQTFLITLCMNMLANLLYDLIKQNKLSNKCYLYK